MKHKILMKGRFLVSIILLLVCLSCSDSDDSEIFQLNNIELNEISFVGKVATIDWNDIYDEDGNELKYKLFIDNVLIGEFFSSEATVTLQYNQTFKGKITTTDFNGRFVELDFDIIAPKSKILFFSSGFGELTALDLRTNTTLWNIEKGIKGILTFKNNLIFSGNEGILGLDILTGETLWSSTPSERETQYYREVIVDDDNVYAIDSYSKIQCVNFETKQKLWERSFLNFYAPYSLDAQHLYVCSDNDDHLYALDKYTGQVNWQFDARPAYTILTNPLTRDNKVYFGDNVGRFYCLNALTGEHIWKIFEDDRIAYFSAPAFYKSDIILSTSKSIYAIDIDGNKKWKYSILEGTLRESLFVYRDKIILDESEWSSSKIVCINADTGEVNWEFSTESRISASPIAFEDTVFVSDKDNLFAIDANSGMQKWKMGLKFIRAMAIYNGEGEAAIYPSEHGLNN